MVLLKKLLLKLYDCIGMLDDINDELEEAGVDTTLFLKGVDTIVNFYSNENSKLLKEES